MKVVPNNARMTVTTKLSKYSRSVDCIRVRHDLIQVHDRR
jgi:hypothetical protein